MSQLPGKQNAESEERTRGTCEYAAPVNYRLQPQTEFIFITERKRELDVPLPRKIIKMHFLLMTRK